MSKQQQFVIEDATLTQARAKIALVGPTGAGKTYTALTLAQQLGPKVLVIDTENKSSIKYSRDFTFQVIGLTDYRLERYLAVLDFAAEQKVDVVVIDSLSHAWAGQGGALEMAEQMGRAKYGGNTFAGWAEVTPLQNRLIETILNYPVHLIATMRMKMKYALVENDKGKKVPRKLGLDIVQRDTFEYEFDIIGQLDIDHNLLVTKTRCSALDGYVAHKPGSELGRIIRDWLTEGAPLPVFPAGWYPTKEQFFAKARQHFGRSNEDMIDILYAHHFPTYDVHQVVQMWHCLQENTQ
jgi:nucleoside-triphosphatase THEP1